MTTTPTLWKAEQQANTIDSGPAGNDQFDQQIVALADGSFVVLWTDNSNAGAGDAAGTDIIGQRYTVEGFAIGDEFRANSGFSGNDEGEFTVAALPDGGFVVVHEDTNANGASIRFTKWDATASNPASGTIRVDPGAELLNSPTVSVNADGSFLVGFQQINAAGTAMNVNFVPVSNTLAVGSPIFAFSGGVPSPNSGPQIASAVLTNGNTVLVSRTDPTDQAGAQDQIIFRLVTASGVVGSSIVVANTATNNKTDNAPSVAALAGGGFVITWHDADVNDTDVVFQRFTAAGAAVGGLTGVNSAGFDDNNRSPDVVGLADGGFVIAYDNNIDSTIKLQRYDANGAEVGDEVTVTGSSSETTPTITLADDGRLLVGWTDGLAGNNNVEFAIFDPRENVINGDGTDETITSRIDGATVNGNGGDDTLIGQDGTDVLNGGADDDHLIGGDGGDTMNGGAGDDIFSYNLSPDPGEEEDGGTINGGADTDSLLIGRLVDNFQPTTLISIERFEFNNRSGSFNRPSTGVFASSQFGGAGVADTVEIAGSSGQNIIALNMTAASTFSAAGWSFIDWGPTDSVRLNGTVGNDTIIGSSQADEIFGSSGVDSLSGGAGDDLLWGDFAGFNGTVGQTFNGGSEIDEIRMGRGGAFDFTADFTAATIIDVEQFTMLTTLTTGMFRGTQLRAGEIDSVVGDAALTQSIVVNGDDVDLSGVSFSGWTDANHTITINGTQDIDTLIGSNQRDTLNGGSNNDTIDGGLNADTMVGEAGDDRFFLDNGGDVVVENAAEGFDTIVTFIDHTIEDNVENMVMDGGNFGTGNAEKNRIDGHGGVNILNGRDGDDQLFGHGGADTLEGGEGADTLEGGEGGDTMVGGRGHDRYVVDDAGDAVTENAGEGLDSVQAFLSHTLAVNLENLILEGGTTATGNTENNRIDGHGADSTLSGLAGNDLIFGYDGRDTLDGGLNADTMVGGAGDDRYLLDNGGDVVIENAGEGFDTIAAFIDHTMEDHVEDMVLEGGNFGTGNAGNNRIDGHGGNNTLNGRGGKDLLIGYGGTDTLTGGEDDDRFVFTQGSGSDTITDMLGGVGAGDVIDIRDFGFANFEAVMAATTNVSGGALIQLDGDNTLFVQNMLKAQFDSNDFLLA